MGTRKKQFVLQFRIDGHGSPQDLDRLVLIEEKLDGALRRNHSGFVDGHDIGSSSMNIFVYCPSWSVGEGFFSLYLKYQDWALDAVIAERLKDDSYKAIWPKDYQGAFQIM